MGLELAEIVFRSNLQCIAFDYGTNRIMKPKSARLWSCEEFAARIVSTTADLVLRSVAF